MRDALMTERSGPACIILRRVKSGRLVKSPFGPSHKPPRFGVPEEIRTPDPTLRRRVLYPAELLRQFESGSCARCRSITALLL